MTIATWTVSWAGYTHQGKVRTQNQDNFHMDGSGRFFILADGMGGHSGGEVASERTVEAAKNFLESLNWADLPPLHEIAKNCVQAATQSLKDWVSLNEEHEDMGTTLLVWIRNSDKIWMFSLGDSRIYLFREKKLFQLTFDQIIESELRRRGANRIQAARSPGSAYLSRCILTNRICEPDILEIDSKTGDFWLLCSDGLSREVDNDEIVELLGPLTEVGAESCVISLIERALHNGGRDNITVIGVSLEIA